ncbi:MAG: peptidase domain-containing ABC transporter [Alphaproteobacteria bacterium]
MNTQSPSSMPLIRDILAASKSKIWEAVFISFVTNILAMSVPIFTMQIYDRVIVHKGIATLEAMVIIIAIVLIFDTILRFGRSRLFQRVGLQVDVELGNFLYKKISKLPLKTLETRDVSSWQTAFRDVETIRGTLSGPTMMTALDLPFAFLFLFVIYLLAPGLLIAFGIIIPLYVGLAFWSGRVVAALSNKERQRGLNRDMFMHEILAGRSTVKALALEQAFLPKYERTQADAIDASIIRGSSTDFHQVLTQSMQLSSTVMVTCIGALLILQQEMSMGTLIAVNMLSARMISPIAGLVGQWRAVQSFRQSAGRLSEIFALPSERDDANLPLDRPKGVIKLENVSYGYHRDQDSNSPIAVDRLTGEIGPGGIHCFMGKNGAGKSTLLKLLAGLYRPNHGRILIDDADISQFSRKDLAAWVGYLPQDCLLFADTIRANIQIGGMPYDAVRKGYDQQAVDAQMIESAKRVGSHAPILDLPDGYDTELGEAGFGLSSGQRRRIALARAMMPDPPIILMDEPTSDLDSEAEEILVNCLRKLAKTHTVIVATHSPLFLNHADSIMVLERGKVAHAGKSSDVLQALMAKNTAAKQKNMQARSNANINASGTIQPPPPPPPNHAQQNQAQPESQNLQNSRAVALSALRPNKSPDPKNPDV